MNNIIWGQYNAADYPLKHFFYKDIPENVKGILMKICASKLAIFRGGIAFIFLLNKTDYELKDIDMLATFDNCDVIINILSESDIVYVNKNTFDDTVITAFWKDGQEFFKLDVLLNSELPRLTGCIIESNIVYTVSASYIWRNRIEKIAEKEKRCHNEKKTKNHYNVAIAISKYLKDNRNEIFEDDARIVEKRLDEAKNVLINIVPENEVNRFVTLQRTIIEEMNK